MAIPALWLPSCNISTKMRQSLRVLLHDWSERLGLATHLVPAQDRKEGWLGVAVMSSKAMLPAQFGAKILATEEAPQPTLAESQFSHKHQ